MMDSGANEAPCFSLPLMSSLHFRASLGHFGPLMASFGDLFGEASGRLPLLIGAVLLYAAARATMEGLARGMSAGTRALGYWIPIAVAAIIASWVGRRDLALSIVFSTSVASLSLVLGAIVAVNPDAGSWGSDSASAGSAAAGEPGGESAGGDRGRLNPRSWMFVLPAALLPFFAGFSGRLTWVHALMFLIEGAVLLGVWNNARPASGPSPRFADRTFDKHYPAPAIDWVKELNIAMYLAGATLGAGAAVWGAWQMSQKVSIFTGDLIVVSALSPILVLPMLVVGTAARRKEDAATSASAAIGVVLLNLCALLPAVILSWYLPHAGGGDLKGRGILFSLITWRVDNVVLVVLAFILLPVALGRWKLGRRGGRDADRAICAVCDDGSGGFGEVVKKIGRAGRLVATA